MEVFALSATLGNTLMLVVGVKLASIRASNNVYSIFHPHVVRSMDTEVTARDTSITAFNHYIYLLYCRTLPSSKVTFTA
jgi:hypothetical protein